MPIIDGYDEFTPSTGGNKFPVGNHTATAETCKLASGTTKNGGNYQAVDVTLSGGGYSEDLRIFYPASTNEWMALEDWQRGNCKEQLAAIGLHMSEIENESARAAVIGREIKFEVATAKSGNLFKKFQAYGNNTAGLPEPERVVSEGTTTTVPSVEHEAVIV